MVENRTDGIASRQGLGARSRDVLDRLAAAQPADRDRLIDEALQLAEQLRREEAMDELARLSDALRQHISDVERTALTATLSAQALADAGQPFAARDVLLASPTPPVGTDAWLERQGLLGRTNKQIFLDATDRTREVATSALDAAIAAYLAAFEAAGDAATWHGINLAALATRALVAGRTLPSAADPVSVARDVIRALDSVPPRRRDTWWHATRAEASLAIRDVDGFARHLKGFVDDSATSTFAMASLLRQLTELWDLERGGPPEARAYVAMLRASLLRRRGAAMRVEAHQAASVEPQSPGALAALEKVFGRTAPRAIAWWQLGLERAKSVAAICTTDPLGRIARTGTGFLVSVHDPSSRKEHRLVLTNAHVIGDAPALGPAIPSADRATVRFEALDPERIHAVRRVVWTSGRSRHDASLLELENVPEEPTPLPLVRDLPATGPHARLYVIGHPLGQELAFSFEDNELLDHEGPPSGSPAQPGVVRLHYRTPTEPGSSGSPAFVDDRWQVVALHHSGRTEMRRLNGAPGWYEANEGISLGSIADALRAETGLDLTFGAASQPG